jgi:hypothetical protein
MNAMPPPGAEASPSASYEATRFNAIQHGVLSRLAVLPWEDRGEYRALPDVLVAEHAPNGPTEGHLVEELAGIFWRKRRLQLAEAAIYRDQLHRAATSSFEPEQIGNAALLPAVGEFRIRDDIPQALTAMAGDTARDLHDVIRDRVMAREADSILAARGAGAYARALAALGEDVRSCWLSAGRLRSNFVAAPP